MKKKIVLFAFLSAMGFAAQACDKWDLDCNGRISADEARASDSANTAQNEANSIPPATEGLEPWIGDDDYGDVGQWVVISTYNIDVVNAGEYSVILAPKSEGKQCAKGSKGLIMGTKRSCNHWNSGGTHCQGYGPEEISDTGVRAECK